METKKHEVVVRRHGDRRIATSAGSSPGDRRVDRKGRNYVRMPVQELVVIRRTRSSHD